MAGVYGFVKRIYKVLNPPNVPRTTSTTPIKFGILGAARIAPQALIIPAKSHPEVIIHAVAARDLEKAQSFAKKHGIPKAYGGSTAYQELLDDPEIDAVYNPLPNGLHYEWTLKALAAGKHVLLEKPSTDTSEEARKLFAYAQEKGLVLLEAFHYRFHPTIQRAKAILESGELGAIKSLEASLTLPKGIMADSDIRFDYPLGGGAMMDMGCYTMNCLRYLSGANPLEVISASSEVYPNDPTRTLIDTGTTATLSFPSSVVGTLTCNLRQSPSYGVIPKFPSIRAKVECEGGEIEVYNYVAPFLYHYIQVSVRDGQGGKGRKKRIEKIYNPQDAKFDWKGEDWWSTYRYQLEAFVDRLKGRTPQTWVTAEDSIANMEAIEMVYEKASRRISPPLHVNMLIQFHGTDWTWNSTRLNIHAPHSMRISVYGCGEWYDSQKLPSSEAVLDIMEHSNVNGTPRSRKLRVILVGIGGATCSGKTTLAKHLRSILPGSVILHQDELIPIHPEYGVQDWDSAEGAIDWPRMVDSLREVKTTGVIPPEHYSHDHLNEQKAVPVEDNVLERWRETFTRIESERSEAGEQLVWVMVDGFLLYWHPGVVDTLDVRVFLRVPHDVLKERRHERHGYHTAEGALWRDPPEYWEQIVWPAYRSAHVDMLENSDIERGKSNGKVAGLIVIEGLELSMGEMVNLVCERLVKVVAGSEVGDGAT
ncbi:hypothetical protein NLI96_g1063 [Meripilus lineatus]|uniref:D-xylose 1-dehydrogenase (NADP(+), D-xylono-1,5-lactone-forming) n=1 Tax=Meripilus lineatus TaxID=2056292 RepID=A0AAD5YHW8_9APHY|nr:hypothetical protein NLI96_g1063 [Physisporinus lineatus]